MINFTTPNTSTDVDETFSDYLLTNKNFKLATAQSPPAFLIKTTTISTMTPLSPMFVPGEFDVICARGRDAKNHVGNRRFRSIIRQCAEKYSRADSRVAKSIVVSEIVESVRLASPNGGFVKQQEEDGQWFEVGDQMAREKVGQSLRDQLDGQYKSSTKAKWRRRRVVIADEVEAMVQSNAQIRLRTQQLSKTLAARQQQQEEEKSKNISNISKNSTTSSREEDEEDLMRLFTQANCDILKVIKTDVTLCTNNGRNQIN